LRITKEVLSRAHQKVTGKGAKFLVLVIPTKESVYAELMQREGRSTGAYQLLVEMENRARNDVLSFCAQKGLVCVDALPNLRSAIARRQQIYPSSTESHPNANGYGILAGIVNNAIK